LRTGADDVSLAGNDMHQFLDQLQRIAHPNPFEGLFPITTFPGHGLLPFGIRG
jgi:hypothetical protein